MKTWWTLLLRKFAMLSRLRSPGQWCLFLRVLTFATAVPLLFNLRLSVLSRLLERRIRSARQQEKSFIKNDHILQCVEIAMTVGQPLVRPRCLIRAVTLYYFLRRTGMDLNLCFGAASKDGQLVEAAGHCWLTKDGEPFLEERDPRASFLPIYWLPGSRPGAKDLKPKIKAA
jgi:hypothetical protein